ncbi:NADH-quinone oxidoreductase subunit M [Candidatus Profftella armatura]|uniref:complex I subunit 4 family protein n=1 Tax=Candidatus Profftella armatura TaxID=669502 RepID=UPI003D99F86D
MLLSTFPILSISIWTPIICGLLILTIFRNKNLKLIRIVSLISALFNFFITLSLFKYFNIQFHGIQFIEKKIWIDYFNIYYFLGIDGLSLWFIPLTAFITLIIILISLDIKKKLAEYMSAFLILSGLIIGAFCALDGMLFYIFFEATLIPIFIIIGTWGGSNRSYAAIKFFLYTLMGSLLMLISMIYLYYISNKSFNILSWHQLSITKIEQIWLFITFFIAFAIKIPIWPMHTWLPDAHVEAPTEGSVILAAIMLKLGCYGLLRFSLPIFPDASYYFSNLIITLSLISIIYISLIAMVQIDIKKLIAYSSIAHMGFVTLGIFMLTKISIQGAIIQMISHALISSAMFISIGFLYNQMKTRLISNFGGIINVIPHFSVFFIIFSLANCSLPGTSGFIGEFMIILSAVKFNFWIGVLTSTALIFSAAYSLCLSKNIIFGTITNNKIIKLININKREFLILGLFMILIIFIGLYPKPIVNSMKISISDLLKHIVISKINYNNDK